MAETDEPQVTSYVSEFRETLEAVPGPMSELLESHSGIPKESQIKHILSLRDKAYRKCPYPCIGTMRFLDCDLSTHEAYQEHVLAPLKQPLKAGEIEPLFLDLGTCFGQDVRKLVFDGAPVERLWASDVDQDLIDLSFALFKDGDKLPGDHFLCPGDLLTHSPDNRLNVLDNKVTILHISAVFHLFTFEDQKTVADRVLRLLRKDTGGPVLVLGGQVGSSKPGVYLREKLPQDFSHKYRHNEETWKNLWEEVCGSIAWKDQIEKLDVRSKLHLTNPASWSGPEPAKGDNLTAGALANSSKGRHMFEVWVTFKSKNRRTCPDGEVSR